MLSQFKILAIIYPLNDSINFMTNDYFQKNGTDAGRFVVYRGDKNIKDLGRVIKFNDEPIQDIWDGDICNEIIGTDSTIFAPFTKKGESIWAFTPDICRSMGTHYVGPSSYAGMPTSAYSLDMGDIKVFQITSHIVEVLKQ